MSLPGLSPFPGQVGQRCIAASSLPSDACHSPTQQPCDGDLLGTPVVLAENLRGPGRPGQYPGHPRGQGPHGGPFPAVAPLGHPLSSTSKPSAPSRKERTVQQVVLCDGPALFSRFSRASLPASVAAAPFPSNDHRANHPFPPPFSHCHSPFQAVSHHQPSRPAGLSRAFQSPRHSSTHVLCAQIPSLITHSPTHLTHLSHRTTVHVWCLTIFSPHATIMHTHCQV